MEVHAEKPDGDQSPRQTRDRLSSAHGPALWNVSPGAGTRAGGRRRGPASAYAGIPCPPADGIVLARRGRHRTFERIARAQRDNRPQGLDQTGGPRADLTAMLGGQVAEDRRSLRSQTHHDAPAILTLWRPDDESAPSETVNQSDHTVMANEKAPGQIADSGLGARRTSPDRQQELMLLGRQAVSPGDPLARREEITNEIPELGQGTIFILWGMTSV